LSQRYDDPYFVQNINRVVTAGMFAGSYHFSRPDIVESTFNSGGIRNDGADEADHFIQMAGAWMRPGYLLPVHDFEAGDGIRTDTEMAQFCIDFSNRIYERMGIRPAIYINGNYAANILGGAPLSLRNQLAQPPAVLPSLASPANLMLWSARWPNGSGNQYTGDIQTDQPEFSYAPIYGPWDDYGVSRPWVFWQYSSGERLPSFNNGGSNLDGDVANGGIEFLKDQLVPAIWTHDGSGSWSTLTNWNGGLAPVAPVTGPGQVAPVGLQTLPTPRLPGAAGSTPSSGPHDTVILDRPNASITVTLSSGTYNIRKLYVRETLNLGGGSLTVNYAPSADSTINGAQFSGSVTLSNGASFSVHTLQVDAARTFTLAGGSLTFNTINLVPHGATPAIMLVNGDVTFSALSGVTATIAKANAAGNSGFIDLGGSNRVLTVNNNLADLDLSIAVPISNGAFTKAGAGTMQILSNNTYHGGTTLSAGRLFVNNPTGSGTGSGAVTVNGGRLGGTGTIAGVVTVNSGGTIAPGPSTVIGTLTLNSTPVLGGTNFVRIDRVGGISYSDRLVLTAGTLNYGGTLVVSNASATLTGGEIFTNFNAPAYSGAFASAILPALSAGLNWYTGGLTVDGSIKVNRRPVASPIWFTNVAPAALQIPFAALEANASDPDSDLLDVIGVALTTTNGITLATNGTAIFYTNHASVIDQFAYTIGDGRGGTVTGVVNIVNIGSTPSAQFVGTPSSNGSSVTLYLSGVAGWPYYLDRTTNLPPVWLPIWTNVAPPGELFDYTDNFLDLPAPPPAAFYRLRWSP
jgi:autotransporter-associated beta strand protein